MSNHPIAVSALKGFQSKAYGLHHPKMMCFTCIDGREGAGRNYLDLGEETTNSGEIAAVIPSPENAPANIRAKFSFRQIKGIEVIMIVGHSSCGGAQIAIAYPDINQAPDAETRDIIESVMMSGEDIPRLRDALVFACEGNEDIAADMLSRHLVLATIKNVSLYRNVDVQIQQRKLDMLPLYHVLNAETNELSSLERYDVAEKRWINTDESIISNMCQRPNDCNDCKTCHDTIEVSLQWLPLQVANKEGVIHFVDVPFHIKKLIEERRDTFQPKTSSILGSHMRPRRIIPIFPIEHEM